MAKKDSIQTKTFLIKIPLYIIPLKEESKGLFGALNVKEMVETLNEELKNFPITPLPSKGKFKTTRITSLDPSIEDMNGVPAILVRASVFESNLKDTYIHNGNEKSKLSDSGEVGGHNYFILFYPKIEGVNSEKYVYTWLQLVYEDPNHNTGIATAVAKKLVKKKLNVQPFNVKLQSAIDDLRNIAKNCPEVKVKYTTMTTKGESRLPKFQKYCTIVKIKEEEEEVTYTNMPIHEVEDLLSDTSDNGEVTITKKAIWGNKEYIVKRSRLEEAKEWTESVEQLFNSSHEATKEDVESHRIYESSYILDVFRSVLKNYLTNQ